MKLLVPPQSGSVAGQTASRNRFGQYLRTRATPVNPNSVDQAAARARLSANASSWRTLTSDQRAGWLSLGQQIQRTDSLGQTYTLNGFMAYVAVNNNNLAAGNAVVADAPALTTPDPLLTAVLTLDNATFDVAYTVTPLPAGARLFAFCSPQRSAGRDFEGDYRLIQVSAAAAASPADILAAYTARFGAPVAGNKIFLSLAVYLDGFLSTPLLVAQIVA